MSDYIERQKVKDIRFSGGINHDGFLYVPYKELVDGIKSLPPADVVQVRHGKWKYKGVCGIENNIAIRRYKCSECREDIFCDYPYNFCPNCGAKMDGEE